MLVKERFLVFKCIYIYFIYMLFLYFKYKCIKFLIIEMKCKYKVNYFYLRIGKSWFLFKCNLFILVFWWYNFIKKFNNYIFKIYYWSDLIVFNIIEFEREMD